MKRVLFGVMGCKALGLLCGFFVPWLSVAVSDGGFPARVRYVLLAIGLLGFVLTMVGFSADWLVSAIVKDAGWLVSTRETGLFREKLVLSKGTESFEASNYYIALEKVLGLFPR